VSPAPPPVFVDDTGRRRALTRRGMRILGIGFAGYLALLAAGFAGDAHLGPLGLPTFGLPGIVHADPAPTALGASAANTPSETPTTAGGQNTRPAAAKAGDAARSATPATTAGPRPTTPTTAAPAGSGGPASPGAAPATAPTTTTTTTSPSNGHGKGTTTTTTTTTSTTSTTAATAPSTTQGPGSSSGAGSAKGPDGTGAPGQLRRPTTTTTSAG